MLSSVYFCSGIRIKRGLSVRQQNGLWPEGLFTPSAFFSWPSNQKNLTALSCNRSVHTRCVNRKLRACCFDAAPNFYALRARCVMAFNATKGSFLPVQQSGPLCKDGVARYEDSQHKEKDCADGRSGRSQSIGGLRCTEECGSQGKLPDHHSNNDTQLLKDGFNGDLWAPTSDLSKDGRSKPGKKEGLELFGAIHKNSRPCVSIPPQCWGRTTQI